MPEMDETVRNLCNRNAELCEEWAKTYSTHHLTFVHWLIQTLDQTARDRDHWRRMALDEDARANLAEGKK